jgi:hypothetical protein
MPIHDNPNIAPTAIARCVLRLMARRCHMDALLNLFFIGNHAGAHICLR